MARLFLTRTLNGWAPADDAAREVARKFTVGQTYRAEIVRPRDLRTLKLWWVLCQMIADNTDTFKSKEQVSDYLKIRAGHATVIVAKSTGEMYSVPDSISFDAMDQTEFQELWKRAIDVVLQDILPGVDAAEVDAEIQRLMGTAR